MLTQQETNFLQYLGKVSEVFKTQIENSEGKQQEIYRRLYKSIDFIVKNYQSFKDGSYGNWQYAESEVFDVNDNVFSRIKSSIGKEDGYKDLEIIAPSIDLLIADKIIGTPPDFFAEILREEFLRWKCGSFSSMRAGIEMKQSFEQAFALKSLGIGYMTDHMWGILQHGYDTGFILENGKEKNINDVGHDYWIDIFDSQKNHNAALTSCKQIEIALKYAHDEKVRDFIEKQLNGELGKKERKVKNGINDNITVFKAELKNQKTSTELKTHLEYTIKRCEEVIEKTRDYQKIAISEISRLFQGNAISANDVEAIAFLTFKKLKQDGNLNGIERINIDEIGDKFDNAGDKTFIIDIFQKVQKRAADEKTNSTIEKRILTVEDFLLAVWYPVKLHLFRTQEARKDINSTSKWVSQILESKAKDFTTVIPHHVF